MSNPGVIVLDDADSKKGRFKRFAIEDNIGESVHLHVDNTRIDLSVDEFFEFSRMVRKSLEQISFLPGFSLGDFDEEFLRSCADVLPNLTEIKVEKVRIMDLKAVQPYRCKRGVLFYKVLPVRELSAYRYLEGEHDVFLTDPSCYHTFCDPVEHLSATLAAVKAEGYPFQNKRVVLFDGQDYIRSGEDLAAVMAHLYGLDSSVDILRFYFKGRKHLLKPLCHNFRMSFKKLRKKIKRFRMR